MELQAFSVSVTSEVDEKIRNILLIHHQMKIYKYEVGSDVWYHLAVKFSDDSLKVYFGKLFLKGKLGQKILLICCRKLKMNCYSQNYFIFFELSSYKFWRSL